LAISRKGALCFLRRSEGADLDYQAMASDQLRQITYLEKENARLQQLVAELLIKNEQLRQTYVASSTAVAADLRRVV
jgi:hypothetical protein